MVMTIIPTILNMAIFLTVTLKVPASLGGHDHGQLGSAVRGWMGCALVISIMILLKVDIQLLSLHLQIACIGVYNLILKKRYTDFLGLPGTLDRVQEMVGEKWGHSTIVHQLLFHHSVPRQVYPLH